MKTFIIPGNFESYRSLKDRTLKLIFETAELSPDQMASIHLNLNNPGFLAFNPDPFTNSQIKEIEEIKVDFDDTGKTRSQRLRAVFYRNWEKRNEGYKAFTDYYNAKMDILIEHYKKKIDEL